MNKIRVMAAALSLAAAASVSALPGAQAAEGCGAVYSAGQTSAATCTYKATAAGAIIAGSVNWSVTVTHPNGSVTPYGGSAPAYLPSSGAPIKAGDVVTAKVFGPGSVIVGTATEGDGVVLPQP